jgi:hypothetical protein
MNRIQTIQQLRDTPLPQYDSSYTIIPHVQIIDEIKTRLANHGLNISKEIYTGNIENQIVTGKFNIHKEDDPDLGLMMVFGNSYNKSRKFKVSIGGRVFVCDNGMILGDMNNFSRKHTGNALEEALQAIEFQIQQAEEHFQILCNQKNQLREVTISKKLQAELAGRLYMEEEIITLSQLSVIKQELQEPSFDYNSHNESGWYFYNAITHSLKKSHPVRWIEDH